VIASINALVQRAAAQLPLLLLLLVASGSAHAVVIRAVNIDVSSNVTTLGGTPLVKDGDVVTVTWNNSDTGDGVFNNALGESPIADVKLDASQLGASSSIQMYDDGSNGDASAGDDIYTGRATVNKGGVSVADARVKVIATNQLTESSSKLDDTPIQIDNTKPVVNFAGTLSGDNNPANGYINKAEIPGGAVSNFIINGTTDAEDNQTVTVKIYDDSGATLKWTKSATVSSGVWSVSLNSTEVSGLKEGSSTIRFTADVKDRVGNSATQSVKSFSKDVTAPPLTINDPLVGDNWISNAEVLSGFAIAGLVTPDGGSTISLTVTDSVNYALTYSLPNSSMSWSQTILADQGQGLADGTITIDVAYTDKAGNKSVAQKVINKDTQAPTIAFKTPYLTGDSNGNGFIDAVSPDEVSSGFIIDGTTLNAQQGRPVTVTVVGSSQSYSKSGTVAANGTWSVQLTSIEASSLLQGDIVLTAQVSDSAGNSAQTQKTLYKPSSITIDDPTATDNRINATEANAGITLSGTIQSTIGSTIYLSVTDIHNYSLYYQIAVTGTTWAQVLTSNQIKVLDDGDLQVTVYNTNGAGVTSIAGKTLVKDVLKPTLNISNPPAGDADGNTYITQSEIDAGFIINGTSNAEQNQVVTVQVTDGSVLFQMQGAVDVNGNWQVALTKAQGDQLKQGTVTISANVNDLAQNAATQATLTRTKDTLAPTAGIAAIVTGDLNTDQTINKAETDPKFTVNGSTSGVGGGRTVTVTVTDGVIATPIQKTTTTATDGTWSVDFTHLELMPPSLVDGTSNILFTARVLDDAGNSGQGTKTFSKDTDPPTVAIAATLLGDVNADDIISQADNDGTFTVNGTTSGAENGQQVTVRISDGVSTLVRVATVSADAWQLDLSTAEINALNDGDQNISIKADVKDRAGNPATQASKNLSKNTGGPSIAINEPIAGDSNGDNAIGGPENDGTFTISGTTTPIATTQGQTVTVTVTDGASGSVVKAAVVSSTGTWSVDLSQANVDALVDGTNNIQIVAAVTDTASNTAQDGFTLSKDTTAPTLTITMPLKGDASGDGIVQANEIDPIFSIAGTTSGLEDLQQITVEVTDGIKTLTQTGVVANNTWQVDFPKTDMESLADGNLQVNAKASDKAGNQGTAPQQQVIKDTTFPELTIDATGAGTDNLINSLEADSFTIDGSTVGVEDNQLVSVDIRDLSGHVITKSTPVSGNAWSVSVTRVEIDLLDEGVNNITIRANVKDLAGNAATEAVQVIGKLTLGSLLSSITSATDGNYTAGASLNITATMQTDVAVGSKMDVTLDTGAVVTLTASVAGKNLVGIYKVVTGQKSVDLNVVGISNVVITDVANNPITSLQIPTGYNLADNKNIAIYLAQFRSTIVRLATTDCTLTESCQIGDKVQFKARVWNSGPTALSGQLGAVSFPVEGIGNSSIVSAQGYGGANWSYTKAVLGPLYVSLPADGAGTTSYVEFILEGTALAAETMSAAVDVTYDGDINNLKIFNKTTSDAVSTTTEWITRPDPSYGVSWSGYMGYLAKYVAPLRVPTWIAIKDGSHALVCGAMAVDWNTATTGYIEVNTAMCMSKLNGVNPVSGSTHFVNGGLTLYCTTRYPDSQNGTVWVWGSCIKADYAQDYEDPDLDGFPNIFDNAPLIAAYSGECTAINGEVNITGKAYSGSASCSATALVAAGKNVSTGTANVTYTAPKVVLLPGFKANKGSVFRAKAGTVARPEAAARAAESGTAAEASSVAAAGDSSDTAVVSAPILQGRLLALGDLPVGLQALLAGFEGEVTDLFGDAAGDLVVLATTAPLVAEDDNGMSDVYLYEVGSGEVRLLSAGADGTAGNGASGQPRMDGGGNYVVFSSNASDLATGDLNGVTDIYLYDVAAARLVRVSYAEQGGEAVAPALDPAIATGWMKRVLAASTATTTTGLRLELRQ